jgi:Competence protein J (ComJ)
MAPPLASLWGNLRRIKSAGSSSTVPVSCTASRFLRLLSPRSRPCFRHPSRSAMMTRRHAASNSAYGLMVTTSFFLSVSYSQIAVFDSAVAQPFSMWTERHVNQGFAWRDGSVSFQTIAGGGRHLVEVAVVSRDMELSSDAARIIQVPFEIPASSSIEVASTNAPAAVETITASCRVSSARSVRQAAVGRRCAGDRAQVCCRRMLSELARGLWTVLYHIAMACILLE